MNISFFSSILDQFEVCVLSYFKLLIHLYKNFFYAISGNGMTKRIEIWYVNWFQTEMIKTFGMDLSVCSSEPQSQNKFLWSRYQ